jgi:hypothetical protein
MNKKNSKTLDLLIEVYAEVNLNKIEGFDRAIIGVEVETKKLIYSTSKYIKLLSETMPKEDAIDYFYFEIYSEKEDLNDRNSIKKEN